MEFLTCRYKISCILSQTLIDFAVFSIWSRLRWFCQSEFSMSKNINISRLKMILYGKDHIMGPHFINDNLFSRNILNFYRPQTKVVLVCVSDDSCVYYNNTGVSTHATYIERLYPTLCQFELRTVK